MAKARCRVTYSETQEAKRSLRHDAKDCRNQHRQSGGTETCEERDLSGVKKTGQLIATVTVGSQQVHWLICGTEQVSARGNHSSNVVRRAGYEKAHRSDCSVC